MAQRLASFGSRRYVTSPLAGKLSAARDNVRFADKPIADLEIQLIDQNQGQA